MPICCSRARILNPGYLLCLNLNKTKEILLLFLAGTDCTRGASRTDEVNPRHRCDLVLLKINNTILSNLFAGTD